MAKDKSYKGIDCFRIISALLIIAIHTSPLSSVSETGDFILTRVIARVAVPFFFMTSGFFLVSVYSYNAEKLYDFVKKTALIYGTAILIYIPINIYNGYFKIDNFLPKLLKDIIFDGTLYHLWYLPASIIGAVIAWYFVKKSGYAGALVITFVLYLAGLFGDSYYGISENISCLNKFYTLIFQISDYTRNGLFFAPVFFVLGGFIADNCLRISFGKSMLGFACSFVLMHAEALMLHRFNLQRHDSMYVFLLPCMFFLFNVLLQFKGKRIPGLRNLSLIIYLIHPMMIIIIRMFAKVLHLQSILIENSIVQYITVCFSSVLFAVIVMVVRKKFIPEKTKHNYNTERAYIEIDMDGLSHNVNVLKKALPKGCSLMAVVKAQAYGHGMYQIAAHINRLGVKAFAAATVDEGIELRRYGISGEILILGYTAPARAKDLSKYDLIQTLISYGYAMDLNKQGYDVKTHIKIDTGMHRLGFNTEDLEKVSEVFTMKHIKVMGIYTHLCVADSLDDKDIYFTKMQIRGFYRMLKSLRERGITVPKVHIQSSYGLLNYPELKCDYVRAGIALYGVLSSSDDKTRLQLDLKPVFSLKSRVILLRKVKKGDSVGYGRAFIAGRDSTIAILPIGYADGIPRSLSCGRGYVLINGRRAYIVGKICMDQLTVDVTDIPYVKEGMTATLIGKDGNEEIQASATAGASDSITNELLSRMGTRLKITYKL